MTAFSRFAAYGDNGGMPEAADTAKSYRKKLMDMVESELRDASITDMKETIAKAKSRLANKKPLVDEDEDDKIIPSIDKGNTMADPFMKMLDKQALAHQAKTGESYAKSFTAVYTDPANASIRDAATYEHIARGHDNLFGYRLATPVKKAAAPPDPEQDSVSASRRGDNPGPAHSELNDLVDDHMKANPGFSYERSFTAVYLHPNNRSLKDRVDSESVMHARRLSPEKPFPRYTSPGHDERDTRNLGREGRGGEDF